MKHVRIWTIWLLVFTVTAASLLCCCVDKVFAKATVPACHLHKMAKSNPQPCECTKKLSLISSEFVHVSIAIKETPHNLYFFDVSNESFSLAQSFLPQWSHDPPGLASIIPLYLKNPTLRI